jgi:polysaccharide pyruvyl transferase WcaK-like protein
VNCDLVFKLPRPATEMHIRHHPLSVGVGMMAYTGWKKGSGDAEMIYDRYIAKMQDFAAWLLEGGMHVRLLTGGSDDRRAIDELMARVGLDEFCQNVETFSTGVLKAQFSAMIRRRFLVEQEIRQVLEVFRTMLEEQDAFLQSALDAGKSAEGVDPLRPLQARRG